jgi:predicted GNAT family N-acyltransferase
MIVYKIAESELDKEWSFEIRKQVFQDEIKYKPNEDVDMADEQNRCMYILAEENGLAIGTMRGRESHKGFRIERICVLPSHRGRQIGVGMVKWFIERGVPENQPLSLGSPPELVQYFETLGFSKKGDKSYWEGGIIHHYMKYLDRM